MSQFQSRNQDLAWIPLRTADTTEKVKSRSDLNQDLSRIGDQNLSEIRSTPKGKNMKIYVLTAITAAALPFMAVGQTTEEPQQTQGQTNETQTTAPTKGKKMHPGQEQQTQPQAKPETGTNVREQSNIKGRPQEIKKNATRSTTGETNVNTNRTTTVNKTVNKEEFRTRHSDVFSLGRHPKEFFVQRYGATHFRLIGNSYFVFVDGCWVAVDVDGFTYTQRVICAGDPDYVVIE